MASLGRRIRTVTARRPRIVLALALAALLVPPAWMTYSVVTGAGQSWADQSHPDLDGLFAQLASAQTVQEADRVEARIWALWRTHDDRDVARLLDQGITAMSTGNFGEALEHFESAIAADPEFAEAHNKRATVLYLMGRDQESMVAAHQALVLEPRHFGAMSGMGLIFTRLDRPEMAIRMFEAAARVHPKDPAIQRNLDELRRSLNSQVI